MSRINLLDLQRTVDSLRTQAEPGAALIDALVELSKALIEVDLAQSTQLAEEALSLAEKLNDLHGQAKALVRLSWLNVTQGHPDQALSQAMHADWLAHRVGDRELQTGALYVIARLHQQVGNFSQAQSSWNRYLHLAQTQNNTALEADARNALGILYGEMGNHTLSLASYEITLKLYSEAQDPLAVPALNNIGYALCKLGQFRRAVGYVRQALERCPDTHKEWRISFLDTLGDTFLGLGQPVQALEYFNQALALGDVATDQYQLAQLWVNCSRAEIARARLADVAAEAHSAAIQAAEKALGIAQAAGIRALQADALEQIYLVYKAMQAFGLAVQYHEQWAELRQSLMQASRASRSKLTEAAHVARLQSQQVELDQFYAEELKRRIDVRSGDLNRERAKILTRAMQAEWQQRPAQ